MQQAKAEQRSAPSVGNALAYFVILYAVVKGWIPEANQTEAALMAGALLGHFMQEVRGIVVYIGTLINKLTNGN